MNQFLHKIKPALIVSIIFLSFYPFGWVSQLVMVSSRHSPLFHEGRLNLIFLWLPIYFLLIRQAHWYIFNKPLVKTIQLLFEFSKNTRDEIKFGLRFGLFVSVGWILLSIVTNGIQYSLGLVSGIWALTAVGILFWVFCDELLFRGILPSLLNNPSRWSKILYSSLLFTLSRVIIFPLSISGSFGSFLLAISLFYFYERWKKLWVGTAYYGTILVIWGCIFGLPIGADTTSSLLVPFHFSKIWGNWYGPLASPFCWIILIIPPILFELQKNSSDKVVLWITNKFCGNIPICR